MSSLICVLLYVSIYYDVVSASFYSSREQALQEAIYQANTEYDKNFTNLEDIKEYQNFMIEQGVDGVNTVYIKCGGLKY